MDKTYNLAFDFGASSGRLMLSIFDGEKIELKEVHRFTNDPVWMNGRFYWDFPRLFHEMKQGLKKASKLGYKISGIGIDTWGVDYGYIDKSGQLLSNPFCYRDPKNVQALDEADKIMSFKKFYEIAGIQKLEFNTVYQIYFDMVNRNHIIKNADALLFMPDLFGFFLTGEKYCEYTIASTSQMIDAHDRTWSEDILNTLNIPKDLLQNIVMPGNIVGYLKEDIMEETEMSKVPIIAVGSHDTASAVCATPLSSKYSAYLSCGTWSLLGIETDDPIINELSLKYNYTNEGGVDNKIRFLKNITGLWIIQQLKRKWSETNPNISYPDIIEAAKSAKRKDFIIDPDDDSFVAPLNMIKSVEEYCIKTNQGKPETMGEIAMAAYNGISNKYKEAIGHMEKIINHEIDVLHMVGGGIQDKFLCQLTADKTGKKVITGPIEASVLGNILMQLKAIGLVDSLDKGREIIKNSFPIDNYYPTK